MPSSQRPSHEDIARRAGVSRPTVSRALQNSPLLPEETCRRIQALAREMGYRPNPLVSALVASRTRRRTPKGVTALAFVTGWPDAHGWRESATVTLWRRAAAARADELGYRLEDFWGADPALSGGRLSRILHARGVCGALIAPNPRIAMPPLQWEHFAAALFTSGSPMPPLHQVLNHHAHTMWLALERASALGCRRIGLALPQWSADLVRRHWIGALLHFQQQLPARRRVPPLVTLDFTPENLLRWVTETKPDAVLSYRTEALGWLRSAGLRVPEDVGFLHLDWTPQEAECSGVNQRHELIGEAAVDLVVAQLHRNERGIPPYQKTVLITGEWVRGKTLEER